MMLTPRAIELFRARARSVHRSGARGRVPELLLAPRLRAWYPVRLVVARQAGTCATSVALHGQRTAPAF